jgi:protoheme IX farnesyltransferase
MRELFVSGSATLTGNQFRRLTVTFLGLALGLVLLHGLVQRMPQIQAWYLGISGMTLLVAVIVAVVAWRAYHHRTFVVVPATGAAILAASQFLLGATWLRLDQPSILRSIHLLATLLTLGSALYMATLTYLPAAQFRLGGLSNRSHKFYFRSILLAGLGFLLLLVTGAMVTETAAGPACPDWPLCRGEIFPADFSLTIAINLLHRFSVVVVSIAIAAVILQTRRRYTGHPLLTKWSSVVGFLFLAQVASGGLYSFPELAQLVSLLHLSLSALIWSSLVVLMTVCYFTAETVVPLPELDEDLSPAELSIRQKAATFFKLTKPWILVLLLITTITAMFIAARGLPPVALILYTLLGGILSAGGASVLNSYIDSDIDGVMSRTSRRATVTGLVTSQETLLFGLTLSALSFLIFAIFVNLFSAILSTIGILYYVFFYTLYLKRTTIHNIIIGGAAGAIPPLVGWTAVTDSLDLGAFYLFAIIFFWTPPHTWALALLVKKDYTQARVPMLPVVVGEKETTYQIFLYSILLITLTLLPFIINMAGWLYLMVAFILGVRFIYLAWRLWRHYEKSLSKRLYKYSQAYLALLFLAMAIDRSLF